MKYFSMFSGIGGFEYGINKATKARCVGFSEIDKYASSIYQKHYPKHRNFGDATTIDTNELEDFDLLVGGFPCQAFSIAGKQLGFCDTRGTLFFEIARVLEDKRPRYFLLENVKGLLSHDKGKTFQTILEVLTSLGYEFEYQVLNSKDFGVPQNRERVFIVGHFGGSSKRKVFPIIRKPGKAIKKIINKGHDGTNIYSKKGSAVTQKALGGGQGAKTGLYAVPTTTEGNTHAIDTNYFKGCNELNKGRRTQVAVPVSDVTRLNKEQNGRRFKTNNESSFTLTQQDKHGVYDGFRIRRLTPKECERLQGFPDDWTKYSFDGKEISDTQRYKCLGNAVTTNVITAIIERMKFTS